MPTHDIGTADGRTLHVVEDGDPGGHVLLAHHGTPGRVARTTRSGPARRCSACGCGDGRGQRRGGRDRRRRRRGADVARGGDITLFTGRIGDVHGWLHERLT